MTEKFEVKYGAVRFDPNDPNDVLAERARIAVLRAYAETIDGDDTDPVQGMDYLLGGLLVGIVQVLQANCSGDPDYADAAIRSSILQTAAWAVDSARAFDGRDPLAEA